MIGRIVERGLSAFTAWAVRRSEAAGFTVKTKGATDVRGLRAYVIPDYVTGTPYITRVLLPWLHGVLRPMLHHIHRPDHERAEHNHPWAWAFSIVLRGSYDEERVCTHEHGCERITKRHVRWFNFIRGEDFHRITKLHGDVWTLFVSGPRVQTWGFREWDLGSERWVTTPSADYMARRKAQLHATDDDHYFGDFAGTIEASSGHGLDAWGKSLNEPRGIAFDGEPQGDESYRPRLLAARRGDDQ